jgi:hypothetical protein
MTPGPVEEAGQTARGVITALSAQPGLLALVVFQAITLGLIGWLAYQRGENMQEERELFAKERTTIIEQCVIPRAPQLPLPPR